MARLVVRRDESVSLQGNLITAGVHVFEFEFAVRVSYQLRLNRFAWHCSNESDMNFSDRQASRFRYDLSSNEAIRYDVWRGILC